MRPGRARRLWMLQGHQTQKGGPVSTPTRLRSKAPRSTLPSPSLRASGQAGGIGLRTAHRKIAKDSASFRGAPP